MSFTLHTFIKLPFAVLTAALLVAPVAAVPSTAAVASASAGQSEIRIGTYNVEVNRSTEEFREGVEALAERSDLIGLQEVDTDAKEDVLNSMSGWNYYRVKPGLQTPVLWRTSRFSFVSARIVRNSKAGYIGKEVPTMKAYQKARTLSVVRLRDKMSGSRITIVNVHLISGATRAGRAWPNRPRLFKMYVRGLVRTATITKREQQWAQVFVLGDFNAGWVADERHRRRQLPFRTFKRLGMRSMWATEQPTNGLGTRNDALIDQICSELKATTAKVQDDIEHSDHRPAIATYSFGY